MPAFLLKETSRPSNITWLIPVMLMTVLRRGASISGCFFEFNWRGQTNIRQPLPCLTITYCPGPFRAEMWFSM